jgi:predicted transcriptional regulator
MTTVTLSVASIADVRRRTSAALRGKPQGAFLSFASIELLWKVLTAKRWDVLRVMTGAGELAIREVARRVGRDVKAVHGDVKALIAAGLVERTPRGILFPYDAIHVDFTLASAA